MRILLLTPQLPFPPRQGTSLRNYHTLRGLAERHQLTLLSFVEPGQGRPEELRHLAALADLYTVPMPERSQAQRLWRMLSDPLPDMGHRLRSAAFDLQLRELLVAQQFDVVQVEGIEMARAMPVVRQLTPQSCVLFDDHNAEAELQYRAFLTDLRNPRRWPAAAYSWFQMRRLRRFEAWAARIADWVAVVSQRDAELVQALAPELEPVVIPNSIDVHAYRSAGPADKPRFDVLFTGKMDYRPNIDAVLWFGEAVWPLIRQKHPQATWGIVGRQPHARLDRLRKLPGVTITGEVPEVQPYLAGAVVFIMPFRMGSGTRLKLLEAMAAGKAIVSTPLGAEGFDLRDGERLRLAETANSFAAAVSELLTAPDLRTGLGRSAAAFALQYDWREIVPRFEAVYASPARHHARCAS